MLQHNNLSIISTTDGQHLEPFIGPRPFKRDKDDQSRFFGRDVETNEIVSLIASHRLVLTYAQSGAGKTSVFNAQVTPELERYGFEVLPTARLQGTATTTAMITALDSKSYSSKDNIDKDNPAAQTENLYIYNAIQSLLPNVDSESVLGMSLFEFLDKYFPNHKDNNGYPLPQVLVFDQLEELFSFYPNKWIDQQKEFFEQVADSLDNNPLLRVVFIIREDFLAQLDPFKGILPEKLRPRFRLERLNRNGAIMAIKGPLTDTISNMDEQEKENIQKEIEEMVDDLLKINVEGPDGSVRQLEGEFVEPIHLQVVCSRWWSERKGLSEHPDNKDKKNRSKDVLKDLTNVFGALEDFYEHAIHDASEKTGVPEREVREWCQQKLITSTGTRSIIHRDRDSAGGLSNQAIKILEDKYLVRREWRAGSSWYELTHDRMIKAVTRLQCKMEKGTRKKKEKQAKKNNNTCDNCSCCNCIFAFYLLLLL